MVVYYMCESESGGVGREKMRRFGFWLEWLVDGVAQDQLHGHASCTSIGPHPGKLPDGLLCFFFSKGKVSLRSWRSRRHMTLLLSLFIHSIQIESLLGQILWLWITHSRVSATDEQTINSHHRAGEGHNWSHAGPPRTWFNVLLLLSWNS